MSFKNVTTEENIELEGFEKVIFKDYQFTCDKQWKDKEKIIIYKATSDEIVKIKELDLENSLEKNASQTLDVLQNLDKFLIEPVMFSGAHTVVDMSNRLNAGNAAVESMKYTLELMKGIEDRYSINGDLLIQINDLFMIDAGNDIGSNMPNMFRKKSLDPYILPTKLNEKIQKYNKECKKELNVFFCAEKQLADRFKKNCSLKEKKEPEKFKITGEGINSVHSVIYKNEEIPYLLAKKSNCVGANAAMLRSIKYKITSNKIKNNYNSYVAVFPLCSIDNVLNGYKAAQTVYSLDLPTYYIFFGTGCV